MHFNRVRHLFTYLVVAILSTEPAHAALAYLAAAVANESTIVLDHGEYGFSSDSHHRPGEWKSVAFPMVPKRYASSRDPTTYPTAWARMKFDRRSLEAGNLALFGDMMKENFSLYLNGVQLYRSSTDADSAEFGWYRPMVVRLPEKLLRADDNEILLRGEPAAELPMGVGRIRIGAASELRDTYQRRFQFKITGPQTINGILVMFSLGFLLLWAGRPKDVVFGWIALVGFVWWFRNLHYFVGWVPMNTNLFWQLSMDAIFALVAAAYGFAATFFGVVRQKRLIGFILAVSFLAGVSRYLANALGVSDVPSFLVLLPLSLSVLYLLVSACWRAPALENIMMIAAVAVATIFGFHDLGAIKLAWIGIGFFLMPYGSLLVFAAFSFALGRRMLTAFSEVEDVNRTLELRVGEITDSLTQSEAERATLRVNVAVDSERARLMREIHDGIGSSLTTALAGAKQRNESPDTIATLTRSLSDLRIGVDSLEPIDGDVVLLLASLRHRMERELKGAGLVFRWNVEQVPQLAWLDPVCALHILRILQEAIGNALVHAQAEFVEARCCAALDAGIEGILIEIADNGIGFDTVTASRGKGMMNMSGRAEAINAKFACRSIPDAGTAISLWLPLDRRLGPRLTN